MQVTIWILLAVWNPEPIFNDDGSIQTRVETYWLPHYTEKACLDARAVELEKFKKDPTKQGAGSLHLRCGSAVFALSQMELKPSAGK